jgi:hypothetical protein
LIISFIDTILNGFPRLVLYLMDKVMTRKRKF